MKKLLIYSFLSLSMTLYSQTITIKGPSETCPNTEETYHVYAKDIFGSKLKGAISWEVFINGVYDPNLSSPNSPCGGSSLTKDFYLTFQQIENNTVVYGWREVGSVELKVGFTKSNSCNKVTKSKFITSAAKDPGLPTTGNGYLTFCPGESKIVYLDPGMPGIISSPENCYYHYEWVWTVPPDWTVTNTNDPGTGNDNSISLLSESVKVTAPSNAVVGSSNYYMMVETEEVYNSWIPAIVSSLAIFGSKK